METKEFATADVLSCVTGRLMGKIDGIYEVCNWASGESVFTHQLPRVSKEVQRVMLERVPALQRAVDERDEVNQENWETWRDRWIERYGKTIAVPRLTTDQHERIDPLSELAEKIHPDKIVVVKA